MNDKLFEQACVRGSLELTKKVLDNCIDPKKFCNENAYWYWPEYCYQKEILNFLTEQGLRDYVSSSEEDSEEDSDLDPDPRLIKTFRSACECDDLERVKELIKDANQESINIGFKIACTRGHKNVIEFILNDATSKTPRTLDYDEALSMACSSLDKDIVLLFLDKTSIEARNKALAQAAFYGCNDIIEEIICSCDRRKLDWNMAATNAYNGNHKDTWAFVTLNAKVIWKRSLKDLVASSTKLVGALDICAVDSVLINDIVTEIQGIQESINEIFGAIKAIQESKEN